MATATLQPSPCRDRVLSNTANLDGDFLQMSLKMAVDQRLFPIAGPTEQIDKRPNKRRYHQNLSMASVTEEL